MRQRETYEHQRRVLSRPHLPVQVCHSVHHATSELDARVLVCGGTWLDAFFFLFAPEESTKEGNSFRRMSTVPGCQK